MIAVLDVLSESGMISSHRIKKLTHVSITNFEIMVWDPLDPHIHE